MGCHFRSFIGIQTYSFDVFADCCSQTPYQPMEVPVQQVPFNENQQQQQYAPPQPPPPPPPHPKPKKKKPKRKPPPPAPTQDGAQCNPSCEKLCLPSCKFTCCIPERLRSTNFAHESGKYCLNSSPAIMERQLSFESSRTYSKWIIVIISLFFSSICDSHYFHYHIFPFQLSMATHLRSCPLPLIHSKSTCHLPVLAALKFATPKLLAPLSLHLHQHVDMAVLQAVLLPATLAVAPQLSQLE